MSLAYFDRFATEYQPYKGGPWCYEDGLLYRGLALLHEVTGEARWLTHLKRLADAQVLEGPQLLDYDCAQFNIDNIQPGRSLLYLYRVTSDPRYLDAAGLLAKQLAGHPRTESGVYWHKLRYPSQIWLDGLYMGLPFQIDFAQETGAPELQTDALGQFAKALEVTQVAGDALYVHAYDEARVQPWADAVTGQSKAVWGRALGWLAMALVDVAGLVGADTSDFAPLRNKTIDLLNRLLELRGENGMWLQVLNRPDLAGNYEEASASAMFTYALQKGAALGFVDLDATSLNDDLATVFLRDVSGGGQSFDDVCEVAGLGMYQGRFRDGSAEYYLTEARVSDEIKGVGPFMMSTAVALQNAAPQAKVASGR